MERDHMDVLEPEEILELLYSEIHKYLVAAAGEDFDQDLIDISLALIAQSISGFYALPVRNNKR